MTSSDSLPQPSELKVLRENAKIELSDLARKTNLSVAQLSQLENGGDHLFYSEEIKRQSIKRVLTVIASASAGSDNTSSAPSKLSLPSSSSDPTSPIASTFTVGADETSGELATQAPPIQAQTKPNYTNPSDHNKSVIEGIVKLSSKSRHSANQLPHTVYTPKGLSPMAWGAIGIGCASLFLYWSPWDNSSTEQISNAATTQVSNTNSTQVALAPTTEKTETSEQSSTLLSSLLGLISSVTAKTASSTNAVPAASDTQMQTVASSLQSGSTYSTTALSGNTITPPITTTTTTTNIAPLASSSSSLVNAPATSANTATTAALVSNTSAVTHSTDKLSANADTTSTNAEHSGAKFSASGGADACQLLSAKATTLAPSNPTKASNYVYLTGSIDTQVCVMDAAGKKTPLQIMKNQGVSVYGKAPWQISGLELAKLQIYFQGWRVNIGDASTQKLQLVEQGTNP